MDKKTILDSTGTEPPKTILDQDAEQQPSLSLTNFRGNKVVEEFEALGAEADVFLVNKDNKDYFLKLYRRGIKINEDILTVIQELSRNHKYFAEIYEYGYDDRLGRYYELSEYIPEGNIEDVEKNTLDIKGFIQSLNKALYLLHQRNIIHRDLKPTNILLRNLNPVDIVLIDFGVSSSIKEDMTKVLTTLKGTYAYTAPEVMSGYIGKEVDYWSFGMILLEMLDKNPLAGLDSNVILNTLATKNIDIPNSIDARYQLLLKGLLTRDPSQRWGYDDVEAWLDGKSPEVFFNDYAKKINHENMYKFKGELYSKKELAKIFLKQEHFEDALKHIGRGYITRYLEKLEEFDEAIKLDESFETPLEKLIYFIYSQEKELPFSLYGIVIDEDCLYGLLLKFIKKEMNERDQNIFKLLKENNLIQLIDIYNIETGKGEKLRSIVKALPLSEDAIYRYFDLNHAIEQNDIGRVKKLLQYNPQITKEAYKKAILSRSEKIFSLLLSTPKGKQVLNEEILLFAIDKGNTTILKELLVVSPVVSQKVVEKMINNDLGSLLSKKLLQQIGDSYGLLKALLFKGKYKLVTELYDQKNLYEIVKKLLMTQAIDTQEIDDILKTLVTHDILDVDYEENGISLIDVAIQANDKDIVEFFIEYSKKEKISDSLIEYIINIDDLELYKAYRQHMPDKEKTLKKALFFGSKHIAKYILEKNHIQDDSLLFELVEKDYLDLLKILIEKNGANVTVVDKKGNTPLYLAFKENKRFISEYLLELNQDIPVANQEGETLLIYAISNEWKFAIEKILKNDAYVGQITGTAQADSIIDKAINVCDDFTVEHLLEYLSPHKITSKLYKYVLEQDNVLFVQNNKKQMGKDNDLFHDAIKYRSEDIAQYLLDNTAVTEISEETLFIMIQSKQVALLESVVCNKIDLIKTEDILDGQGNTLLHIFAQKRWESLLSCILSQAQNIDLSHRNKDGQSFTDILIETENVSILKMLPHMAGFSDLQISGNIKNVILNCDDSELYDLYRNNLDDTEEFLYSAIKQKAKNVVLHIIASEEVKLETRLLFLAIATDQLDIVKAMHSHGMDLNSVGKYGDAPIVYAIKKDRKKIVEFLLMQNVNLNVQDSEKNNLLHLVLQNNWTDLIEKFDTNTFVNQKNIKGETPLMYYFRESKTISKNTIDRLLELGARIDVSDIEGISLESVGGKSLSMVQAAKNRDDRKIELLKNRGGDIDKALHELVDEYIAGKS